ncbi:MAG: TetR/AcrR family transcriptional regulator [Negativicutes bacterium]
MLTQKPLTQRQVNSLETKSTIYNTALMLFAKHGFDKVTIDDIAKYSGVSKGTFYTHFKSKDHVFLEQFEKIDSHYELMLKNVHPQETATNRLLVYGRALTGYCSEVAGLNIMKIVYANQISITSKHPKLLNNESRKMFPLIHEIVILGQEQGEFRDDIPSQELLMLILRWCRALIYDWCLYDGSFDLNEEGRRYFLFIIDFLKKR